MLHGIAILLILVGFIIVVIFLTILWHIAVAMDQLARAMADLARDLKKLADKGDK
jgi:hypothetical protein